MEFSRRLDQRWIQQWAHRSNRSTPKCPGDAKKLLPPSRPVVRVVRRVRRLRNQHKFPRLVMFQGRRVDICFGDGALDFGEQCRAWNMLQYRVFNNTEAHCNELHNVERGTVNLYGER